MPVHVANRSLLWNESYRAMQCGSRCTQCFSLPWSYSFWKIRCLKKAKLNHLKMFLMLLVLVACVVLSSAAHFFTAWPHKIFSGSRLHQKGLWLVSTALLKMWVKLKMHGGSASSFSIPPHPLKKYLWICEVILFSINNCNGLPILDHQRSPNLNAYSKNSKEYFFGGKILHFKLNYSQNFPY